MSSRTRKRRGSRKRRALRSWLLKRDKRCHICGGLFGADMDPADELYPTIDHVIPLSAGGADDGSNMKLAHRVCNDKKGARLPLESRLQWERIEKEIKHEN